MDNTHQTAAGNTNANCGLYNSESCPTPPCPASYPFPHQKEQILAVYMYIMCKAVLFRVHTDFESMSFAYSCVATRSLRP